MALPGIGAISGGQGGIKADLGGGPSSAGSGTAGGSGGQIFRFDTPKSIQAAQAVNIPLVVGLAVVGLWLYKRS